MKRMEFDAVIESADHGGAYVRVPCDIRKDYGKGRLKVHAVFDYVEYDGSVVNMGVKNEDGTICYIIGIRKDIRNDIHKQIGDTVHVILESKYYER